MKGLVERMNGMKEWRIRREDEWDEGMKGLEERMNDMKELENETNEYQKVWDGINKKEEWLQKKKY